MTIATGFHLFPFRTEKLSLPAPMVLRKWESRSSPTLMRSLPDLSGGLLCFNKLTSTVIARSAAMLIHLTSTVIARSAAMLIHLTSTVIARSAATKQSQRTTTPKTEQVVGVKDCFVPLRGTRNDSTSKVGYLRELNGLRKADRSLRGAKRHKSTFVQPSLRGAKRRSNRNEQPPNKLNR